MIEWFLSVSDREFRLIFHNVIIARKRKTVNEHFLTSFPLGVAHFAQKRQGTILRKINRHHSSVSTFRCKTEYFTAATQQFHMVKAIFHRVSKEMRFHFHIKSKNAFDMKTKNPPQKGSLLLYFRRVE